MHILYSDYVPGPQVCTLKLLSGHQKQATDGEQNSSWSRHKVVRRRRGISSACVCVCVLYSISWTSSSPMTARIAAGKHTGSDELISCGPPRVLARQSPPTRISPHSHPLILLSIDRWNKSPLIPQWAHVPHEWFNFPPHSVKQGLDRLKSLASLSCLMGDTICVIITPPPPTPLREVTEGVTIKHVQRRITTWMEKISCRTQMKLKQHELGRKEVGLRRRCLFYTSDLFYFVKLFTFYLLTC